MGPKLQNDSARGQQPVFYCENRTISSTIPTGDFGEIAVLEGSENRTCYVGA
jgi:hypothetical protein